MTRCFQRSWLWNITYRELCYRIDILNVCIINYISYELPLHGGVTSQLQKPVNVARAMPSVACSPGGTTMPLNIFKIYGRFTFAVALLCL